MTKSLILLLIFIHTLSALTTFTPYTGKCFGGTRAENEAGKTTHYTSDCKGLCERDASCTGYNTKSTHSTWCLRYTSRFIRAESSGYGTWTCFIKDDPYYDTLPGPCKPADNYQDYNDRNCVTRCDNDLRCTATSVGQIHGASPIEYCRVHYDSGIANKPVLHMLYTCIYKKSIRYTFYLHTGYVGSDSGASMTMKLHGDKGIVSAGNLAKSGYDLPVYSKSKYERTLRNAGYLNKITITTSTSDRWCPYYIVVFTEHNPIPELYIAEPGCLSTRSNLGDSTLEFFPSTD